MPLERSHFDPEQSILSVAIIIEVDLGAAIDAAFTGGKRDSTAV
jgi:hypothetical protein